MKIFAHNTKFLYSATLHTLCNTAHVLGQYTVPYHRKKPNKSIIKYKKQISNNFSIRLIFNQTYILNTIIFWLFRHTNFNTCNLKLKKNPKNASQNMVSSKILEQNAVLSRNQNTAGREIQKMQKKCQMKTPQTVPQPERAFSHLHPPPLMAHRPHAPFIMCVKCRTLSHQSQCKREVCLRSGLP